MKLESYFFLFGVLSIFASQAYAQTWQLLYACVSDASTRLLSVSGSSSTSTISACQSWCAGQSMIYAGVENGNECWCGNTLNTAVAGTTLPVSSCSTPCSGDATSNCGGPWALTVYTSAPISSTSSAASSSTSVMSSSVASSSVVSSSTTSSVASSSTSSTSAPAPTAHYVLGGTSPFRPTSVGVRYEINTLIGMPYQWPLFVQAMAAMQTIFSASPDHSLGSFALAAIHGEPFISWNDSFVVPRGTNVGYCTHGTVLFPAWHRPYTAMYEQIMRAQAIKIAATYTSNAANFQAAAQDLRFPYWDWGTNAVPPAAIISSTTLTITGPSGSPITVPNPFLSFNFQGTQSTLDPNWSGRSQTVRYPSSSHPTQDLTNNLNSLKAQTLQHLRQMFQFVNTWPAFADHTTDPSNTDKSNSLESIHDSIHITLGGGGHFGDPAVAAFDPVFFMHHSNVDRLIALWQAFYPNVWVSSAVTASNTQTRFSATGDAITSTTPLAPFWSDQVNYWTSDASRSIATFQYTYPEFVGAASNSVVQSRVRTLYGFTGGPAARRQVSGSAAASSLAKSRYFDWSIRVRFNTADLGRSFAVHVFLGAAPASNFMQAATYVGSAFAFSRSGEGVGGESQSFVQLAQTLVEKGKPVSLDPSVITPYLAAQLSWVVTEADLTTTIPVASLPSLEVLAMAAVVTPASSSDTSPHRDAPAIYRNVTHGKAGGSGT